MPYQMALTRGATVPGSYTQTMAASNPYSKENYTPAVDASLQSRQHDAAQQPAVDGVTAQQDAAESSAADAGAWFGPTYGLLVTLRVKPSRREEFLRCIRANREGTLRTEPLALLYQWGESATELNTFYFQEAYKGKAGFEAHTRTAHFAAWEEFAATDPFTAAPEVCFFNAM